MESYRDKNIVTKILLIITEELHSARTTAYKKPSNTSTSMDGSGQELVLIFERKILALFVIPMARYHVLMKSWG